MIRNCMGMVAAAAAVVAFSPGLSQASEWKPTRNVEFIIPYGPGGGFDTFVRRLSPILERHIDAGINVVPRNVTGGSGTRAAIELSRERGDGTKIMIFNLPGHAVFNIDGDYSRYDMRAFTWLARISTEVYVMVVAANSPFRTLNDLKALPRPVKQTELGPGGTSYMTSEVIWRTLGKEVQFITGYKSSADYSLAVIRGDGDATLLAAGSFRRYISGSGEGGSADLRAVIELTDQPSQFPGTQNAIEAGYPSLAELGISRMVAGPPGMAANIRASLEESLRKAITDPEFVDWVNSTGQGSVAYLNGAHTASAVDSMIKSFAAAR